MNSNRSTNTIHPAERLGNGIAVIMLALLTAYFVAHQNGDTGFFTEHFGTLEAVALYGPLLVAFVPPLLKAITGRRSVARPVELFNFVFTALGGLWLLIRFPFEFAHFADVLPESLRFILAWINNDLAKIPLVLMIVTAPFSIISAVRQGRATRQPETLNQSQQPS